MTLRPSVPVSGLIDVLRPRAVCGPVDDRAISQVTDDSRAVGQGATFVALVGSHTDGHRFLGDALARGAAAAVIGGRTRDVVNDAHRLATRYGAPLVEVDDAAAALSKASAYLYGRPSERLTVIGITGTAGKSTTCRMTHSLLTHLGEQAGLISTSGIDTGAGIVVNPNHVTTPLAPDGQRLLAEMVAANLSMAVVEASSHGLSDRTHRLADVSFDIGVVTNFSHDHLELHGSLAEYETAKASLLGRLVGAPRKRGHDLRCAVLNRKLAGQSAFTAAAAAPIAWFDIGQPAGMAVADADCRAENIVADGSAQTFDLVLAGQRARAQLPLPLRFDLENCLAAVLATHRATGVAAGELAAAISGLSLPPMRTQELVQGQPFRVVIDYAHTPAEFEAVLQPFSTSAGRTIVVFGSAGERDVGKRPMQGEIAARYADIVILTEEDNRSEDGGSILEQIAAGCHGKTRGVDLLLEPDRGRAISTAATLAEPGDTVLLLGKGHEASIMSGTGERPWNEIDVARGALESRGFGTAPS